MFAKNVEFKGPAKLSPWRKIAMGTWSTCGDPSVYGSIEIDATKMLEVMEKERQKGVRVTPTILVAKAIALGFREFPIINTVLRFGRLYERKHINVFLQVSPEGKEDNLSGMVIRDCDQKPLAQIAEELQKSVPRIKRGDDFEYKKMKGLIEYIPAIFLSWLLKFISFLLYDLNIWSPLFNTPKDSFGSIMVTSIGMLGIENGFAPLVPYSRCPALLAVGEIKKKALVVNDEIQIRPVLTIGVTFDHRQIDGKGASYMLKAFRQYLENPT